MKVKELVEHLQTLDQEAEIFANCNDDDYEFAEPLQKEDIRKAYLGADGNAYPLEWTYVATPFQSEKDWEEAKQAGPFCYIIDPISAPF